MLNNTGEKAIQYLKKNIRLLKDVDETSNMAKWKKKLSPNSSNKNNRIH